LCNLLEFLFFGVGQGAKGAEVAKLILAVGFDVFTPFLPFGFCV